MELLPCLHRFFLCSCCSPSQEQSWCLQGSIVPGWQGMLRSPGAHSCAWGQVHSYLLEKEGIPVQRDGKAGAGCREGNPQ